MPKYSLIEYSLNYSDTTGSLWICSKDEATNFKANKGKSNDLKSFEYEPKLSGNAVADGNNSILKSEKIAASLRYLSKF